MANRSVTVWKSVKVDGRWKYCRPVIGKNNKIKPDWVKVNGHEEHHEEGWYYIHYREGAKQVWKKIGTNVGEAERMAEYSSAHLHAVAVGVPVQHEEAPVMVSSTLAGYLEEYRLSQSKESYALMRQTLEEFVAFNRKNIVSHISRLDLLKYKEWLMSPHPQRINKKVKMRTCSIRTAGGKMLRVNQYLRSVLGIEAGKGVVTVKDAKYVELEPVVYSQAELDAFFAACSPFHLAVFKTFLMSGFRKQELESLTWPDVSYTDGTLKVCAKEGFRPKTWEERVVEVPTDLLEILKELPRRGELVFANSNGQKYTHAWDDCKAIAKVAGVKDAHPHKFRATFATRLLQSGVDLKTVQKLGGWKNLESVMRYLARAESSAVRLKVNAAWNGKH